MEKSIKISMLLEIYGKLLTERQADTVDLYYNQNLSLSEIADEINVTRQAVRKSLVEAEKNLFEYEKKLNFLEKNIQRKEKIDKILNSMELCYSGDIPEKSKKIVRKCYDKLDIAWAEELDFWQKEFYRLGVIDGMRMNEEIKENIKKLEKKL